MKTITVKEWEKLPINDPKEIKTGELFIIRNYDAEVIDPEPGKVISLFEVIKLTEHGYESKMVHYKVVE